MKTNKPSFWQGFAVRRIAPLPLLAPGVSFARRAFGLFALAMMLAAPLAPAAAQSANYLESSRVRGVAIGGYDAVAYFKQSRATPGSREHVVQYEGAEWRFASEANRKAFLANPETYLPQYGGNCAWAVSRGYKASTDPEAWHVRDGKLYLNYSQSVRKQWSGDIPGNIRSGDSNWPKLRGS